VGDGIPIIISVTTSMTVGNPGNLQSLLENMPASIRLFVANVPDGSCMSEDFSTFLCTTKSPVENVLQ